MHTAHSIIGSIVMELGHGAPGLLSTQNQVKNKKKKTHSSL